MTRPRPAARPPGITRGSGPARLRERAITSLREADCWVTSVELARRVHATVARLIPSLVPALTSGELERKGNGRRAVHYRILRPRTEVLPGRTPALESFASPWDVLDYVKGCRG